MQCTIYIFFDKAKKGPFSWIKSISVKKTVIVKHKNVSLVPGSYFQSSDPQQKTLPLDISNVASFPCHSHSDIGNVYLLLRQQINIAEITMTMTRYKVSPIVVHRRKAWWKAEFFFGLGCVGLMRVVDFPEEVVACGINLTLSILLFFSFHFLYFRINSTHSSFA